MSLQVRGSISFYINPHSNPSSPTCHKIHPYKLAYTCLREISLFGIGRVYNHMNMRVCILIMICRIPAQIIRMYLRRSIWSFLVRSTPLSQLHLSGYYACRFWFSSFETVVSSFAHLLCGLGLLPVSRWYE